MTEPVSIYGMGVATPLGLSAAESAAAVRAGLSAFEESSMMDKAFEPFVVASIPEDDLPAFNPDLEQERFLSYREARLLKLTKLALDQLNGPLQSFRGPCSIYVGLPDFQSQIPLDGARFLSRLSKQVDLKLSESGSRTFTNGRAAGLLAIHEAVKAIQTGKHRVVIAGGVDSYHDLYVLGTLDLEKRVNSARNMDGFTPGEGAAFLILASQSEASTHGWQPGGRLIATAHGAEDGHLYSDKPYRGDGLAATVRSAFASIEEVDLKVQTVFSSMNGENHFAKEWGVAYIRNQDHIENEYRIEHPADCIGDTGAASGPIMISFALIGFRKQYLKEPALVYASSDRADRVASIVKGI